MHKYTYIKWIIIYWAVSLWHFCSGDIKKNDEKRRFCSLVVYWHFCVGICTQCKCVSKNTKKEIKISLIFLLLDMSCEHVRVSVYVCFLFCYFHIDDNTKFENAVKLFPLRELQYLFLLLLLLSEVLCRIFFKSIYPSICLSVYLDMNCLFLHFFLLIYHSSLDSNFMPWQMFRINI